MKREQGHYIEKSLPNITRLKVTRKTAAKYLDKLNDGRFLQKQKIGVNHYYINEPLFELFTRRNG